MDILFVCTANRCRSPVAEALSRRHFERGRVAVQVHSAGFLDAGFPVPDTGLELMARRGYDLRTHLSRQLTDEIVGSADLVLGMAREHVRSLVARWPDAWERSFTVADFVHRTESSGTPLGRRDPADWLRQQGRDRDRAEIMGSSSDDIADPMGRADRVWESVIAELDELTGRLVPAFADPVRTRRSSRLGRHRRR